MKIFKFFYYFSFGTFVCLQQGFTQEPKIKSYELKGYIKDLQTFSLIDDLNEMSSNNLIHNRLNFKWNITKHFSSRLEARTRIYSGDQLKAFPNFGKYISKDNGPLNLSVIWLDKKSLVITSILDRALLKYSTERISITAGRQRINWGINTVWNPNDWFNAFNFLDFDYEERPGNDAIRVQYFFRTLSSLEIAYKPSDKKNQNVTAILYKFNKWKYDVQLLGGLYYSDIALGAGWAGNIKDAGFKGECAYFRNKDNLKNGPDDFTASVTFDYSLKNSWYVSASALYVQNPSPVLSEIVNPALSSLSAKQLMPYRYSIYTGVMKSFSALINGNLAVIYSPEDNSTIIFPTLSYNAGENFDLDLSAQSIFSEQTAEYKTKGNSIFLRMRWSY